MKHSRILLASCAALVLAANSAQAQLRLTTLFGGPLSDNYGPTSTAFAKDLINNGGYTAHQVPHLNDGLYGNDFSWIGASANSYAGLSFGSLKPIQQVAWGRDNTVGGFNDRSTGTYTLQYTTAANPGTGTPDGSWINIGSVGYDVLMNRRAVWNFPQVMATGIRLMTSDDGTCIDELEIGNTFSPAKLTLTATGGTMRAGNVGLSSAGAIAFAKDVLGNGSFAPTHTIPNLNDGVYGNGNSWIGNSNFSFAGIRLASAQTVNGIAFGRDPGAFTDRDTGNYLIQYTTVANPDANTTSWTDLGAVNYDASDLTANQRHEYSFAPVAGVTGIRVYAPGDGIGSGRAIDEIEVYAVPEPASAAFLLVGGAALAARRRRK